MSEDAHNPEAEKAEVVEHKDSVLDALFKAADKADRIDKVLIIYQLDDGTTGTNENNITRAESLWLVEAFKAWLFRTSFPSDAKD